MKDWLTAREIAEERLPHLPTAESSVIRLAKRENWDQHPTFARRRSGLGGGLEYHFRLLPSLAQIAYFQKYKVVGDDVPELDVRLKGKAELTDRETKERDARLAVLSAYELFSRGLKLNQQACIQVFCDRYQMGSIRVDEWVKSVIPATSRRTLLRWLSAKRSGTADALGVDRSKARAGTGLLETANNGAVRAFVLAWIARSPHLSADIIRGYCEDHFGAELTDRNGELKPLPPPRTFQHFIKALKASENVVLTKITDPDKFRSTMKLSGTGTYRYIDEPNALWMIDASPVDALCVDGRYSMYACIDIATRRLIITLSKTPRASSVGLLIRKSILKWGVARVIKTDNGSDFVAIATKRLFSNLDTEADVSDAYSPEQKGHVERVIKTFQHEVCPQLPGYIGHNVADRKAIEGRKSFAQRLGADENDLFEVSLTAEQLQRHIDDWVEYVYATRVHSALNGRSPEQVVAASMTPIRRVDERALDALLMPVAGKNGIRTVGKQGIKHDNAQYLIGSVMVGTDVFCRLDPIDMGRLYAFSADDGRYLDVAICPERAGINPQTFVKAQKELAAELIREKEREIKADIRELKRGPSGIERTIRLAKKKAAEREAAKDNVIQLPKREEQHTTPAIAAAIDAMTIPQNSSTPKPLNDQAAKLHEAIVRESAQRVSAKVVHLDPDAGLSETARRVKWALAIDDQIAAGAVIDDETAIQLARFKSTPQYRTAMDCMKDFGLENALRML
ncbi:DDE-type integrase/transposase/recombinase (plasmid) [Rhizobium lusitanum]|uniref:Mu transposase C-terminal domain-containing protein n=1 Tax=Rhizobium lusitanum TaxID=293958 RepID=UPI0016084AB8|nr:Mu transposase C-terminal domain-containing protein [Rhizobium lusitanum]QND45235.1 DDE-type integrase/transposase/recombinase [Rhizobium lusitanum]